MKATGERCGRSALPGRPYCWQHESKWLTFSGTGVIIGAALFILAVVADLLAVTDKLENSVSPTATATITLASTAASTATLILATATAPNSLSDFTYTVRVIGKVTRQHVVDAHVVIEVAGKAPLDGYADSNGYARLFIVNEHLGQLATINVSADGFRPYRQEIDLYRDQLPDVIVLEPNPPSSTSMPTPTERPEPMATAIEGHSTAISTLQASTIYETFNGAVTLDWKNFQGEWGVIDDRLTVRRFEKDYAGIIISYPAWPAYSFEIDMGTFQYLDESGDPNVTFSYFHVFVNLQENTDGYWFTVTNGGVSCDLYYNRTRTGLLKSQSSSHWNELFNLLTRQYAGDHKIKISVRADKYEFYVDDKQICSFQDKTLTTGALGVAVRQGASGRMWIDNVRLSPQK